MNKIIAILFFIYAALWVTGCYTTEDLENDRRQDLWGYIMGLEEDSETEY